MSKQENKESTRRIMRIYSYTSNLMDRSQRSCQGINTSTSIDCPKQDRKESIRRIMRIYSSHVQYMDFSQRSCQGINTSTQQLRLLQGPLKTSVLIPLPRDILLSSKLMDHSQRSYPGINKSTQQMLQGPLKQTSVLIILFSSADAARTTEINISVNHPFLNSRCCKDH